MHQAKSEHGKFASEQPDNLKVLERIVANGQTDRGHTRQQLRANKGPLQ